MAVPRTLLLVFTILLLLVVADVIVATSPVGATATTTSSRSASSSISHSKNWRNNSNNNKYQNRINSLPCRNENIRAYESLSLLSSNGCCNTYLHQHHRFRIASSIDAIAVPSFSLVTRSETTLRSSRVNLSWKKRTHDDVSVLAFITSSPITNNCRLHHQGSTIIPSCFSDTRQRRMSSSSSFVVLNAIQVTIRMVGRKGSGEGQWVADGCSMYETRLRPNGIDIDTVYYKDNAALVKAILPTGGAAQKQQSQPHRGIVILDSRGQQYTSEQFSKQFYNWIEKNGSRLQIIIGGAEGLPEELKFSSNQPYNYVSISDMTFTHQFVRLLLLEQIYRASEIRKGSNYHK